MDTARLKESFALVATHGDEASPFFYADLFLSHPETRAMFPVSMAARRDRLLQALARIVSGAGNLDELTPFPRGLGRDHRTSGTPAGHHEPAGTSLPATLAHVSGERAEGLYDLPDLEKFGASAPWLTLAPCVSGDPGYPGEHGTLPDVVARSGSWAGHDAYLAGPAPMAEAMAARLASLGVPRDQIHVEDFGWSEP